MARYMNDNLFAENNPARSSVPSRSFLTVGVFLQPYRNPTFFPQKRELSSLDQKGNRPLSYHPRKARTRRDLRATGKLGKQIQRFELGVQFIAVMIRQ